MGVVVKLEAVAKGGPNLKGVAPQTPNANTEGAHAARVTAQEPVVPAERPRLGVGSLWPSAFQAPMPPSPSNASVMAPSDSSLGQTRAVPLVVVTEGPPRARAGRGDCTGVGGGAQVVGAGSEDRGAHAGRGDGGTVVIRFRVETMSASRACCRPWVEDPRAST